MKKIAITLFIFITSCTLFWGQDVKRYLVNSNQLNVRTGPGKEFEISESLNKGDAVTLLHKESNGWWEVITSTGQGYVYSSMLTKDPWEGWEPHPQITGGTSECENIVPQFDYNMDNYLKVIVQGTSDAVVKLIKTNGNVEQCIRIVYVKAGDTYEIKHIPEGLYYVKIAYGNDYRKKIVDNQCVVKFLSNAIYKKDSKLLDYRLIEQPSEYRDGRVVRSWSIPSFDLILTVRTVSGKTTNIGNESISEKEFNE